MFNVLIAEDDVNLLRLMAAVLRQKGYNPIIACDGAEALEALDREHVDLLISDIMMPKVDGYTLVSSLRESGYTMPIIMVTARESFSDKSIGFSSGADDYMVKPIDINELVLRVGALLRRSGIEASHRLDIGGVTLDYDALTVAHSGKSELLPRKEFYLLFKLLSCPRQIFTRQQLMDEIWGMDSEADERTVDVHIKRLRERFSHLSQFEIITVRGLGYKAERNV